MTDRVSGAPGQYQAVITAEELEKMQDGEEFVITLSRDDQPITEGTPYSKAAVLPDALAAKLCPDIQDPTPANALQAIAGQLDTALISRGNLPAGTDLNTFYKPGVWQVPENNNYRNFPSDLLPSGNAAYVIVFGFGGNKNCAIQIVLNFSGATRRIRSIWFGTAYPWTNL